MGGDPVGHEKGSGLGADGEAKSTSGAVIRDKRNVSVPGESTLMAAFEIYLVVKNTPPLPAAYLSKEMAW